MSFVVEVETGGKKRIVGKASGKTIFNTRMEAESVATMFRHTLSCEAKVRQRKEPTPWTGSVQTVDGTEILLEDDPEEPQPSRLKEA